MPNRLVREGILDSKAVNSLSEPAEILYRRLINVVDDFGRFEADVELIRSRCFARQLQQWPEDRIEAVLPELSAAKTEDGLPLVLVYVVGAKQYIEIQNFKQRIRASNSKYPAPSARDAVEALRSDGRPVTDRGMPSDGLPQASRARTSSSSSTHTSDLNSSEITFLAEVPKVPKGNRSALAWPSDFEFEIWFQARWQKHPIPGKPQIAQGYAIDKIFQEFTPAEFDAVHDAWVEFWAEHPGERVPNLATFIFEFWYRKKPPARASPSRNRQQENLDQWNEV